MAVTFVGAGAIAGNATAATQAASSHASSAIGDIYIAMWINKSTTANTISAPDGTWTQLAQGTNSGATGGHQYALFWKRATAAGAQSFTFTKATDDNVLFAGVIATWTGCGTAGNPVDPTAVGVTATTASADNVSFPAFDPTYASHVIFCAYYGNDLTTYAAAMSGDTNPDCTTRTDQETNTGTDASLAITSGDSDGSNIASRTWASASSADAANTGIVFALLPTTQTTKTQTAIARITDTVDKTQTAIARITVHTTKTQTALARITDTVDKTQTALARITDTVDKTQTALARVTDTVDQTITAKANITTGTTVDQTQTARARITDTVDKTQTALARITDQVSQTQTAVARITDTVDRTQTALARITDTQDKTQTALARVTVHTDKTQTALARITDQVLQTQTAIGRITDQVLQTITAKAAMILQQTKTQTARARITDTVDQTISAKARIGTLGEVHLGGYTSYDLGLDDPDIGACINPEHEAAIRRGDWRWLPR